MFYIQTCCEIKHLIDYVWCEFLKYDNKMAVISDFSMVLTDGIMQKMHFN